MTRSGNAATCMRGNAAILRTCWRYNAHDYFRTHVRDEAETHSHLAWTLAQNFLKPSKDTPRKTKDEGEYFARTSHDTPH